LLRLSSKALDSLSGQFVDVPIPFLAAFGAVANLFGALAAQKFTPGANYTMGVRPVDTHVSGGAIPSFKGGEL
jgi:hypothetical protein